MPRLDEMKAERRRELHDLAAVQANLVDDDHESGLIFGPYYEGEGLLVRYHNKLVKTGDITGEYADVIDGIDRLVFLDSNVAEVSAELYDNGEAPLVLSRGAVVTIPGYKGLKFILDSQEPPEGPEETAWVVARTRA